MVEGKNGIFELKGKCEGLLPPIYWLVLGHWITFHKPPLPQRWKVKKPSDKKAVQYISYVTTEKIALKSNKLASWVDANAIS